MSRTDVKTLRPPITSMTMTKTVAGQIAGTVTALKRCHQFAPSTRAASSSSFGTPWRAARKIIIDQPIPFHTPSAQIAIIAVQRFDSHEVSPAPRWALPSM